PRRRPPRSPNVRVLAAYAQNTACALAGLAFSAGVNLDKLLVGTRFQAPFGQSPFAFQRGLAFEKSLRADSYEPTLGLLRAELKDPLVAPRIENLRDRYRGTPDRMLRRLRDTQALLDLILKGHPTAPHLIDRAVLRGSVGGIEAHFEADALAARAGGEIR